MSRVSLVLLAPLVGTGCLYVNLSESSSSASGTAITVSRDTGPPIGEDIADRLTDVLVCGDLDVFVTDPERTVALRLARDGAAAEAYDAETTTTWSWKAEDGITATLWAGTVLLDDPCSDAGRTAVYTVYQGTVELKVSPSELAPTDDGYPVRISVLAGRAGFEAAEAEPSLYWISSLDASWDGVAVP